MAKYPFLPQVRAHIAKPELDYKSLAELPGVRDRAKQRIIASFDIATYLCSAQKEDETEIASFPLAILYIAAAKDRRLTERFSLFEAQKINAHLKKETRGDVILEIAKALKWNINYNKTGEISTNFYKFLRKHNKRSIIPHFKVEDSE